LRDDYAIEKARSIFSELFEKSCSDHCQMKGRAGGVAGNLILRGGITWRCEWEMDESGWYGPICVEIISGLINLWLATCSTNVFARWIALGFFICWHSTIDDQL
jgi:hypothetical protein